MLLVHAKRPVYLSWTSEDHDVENRNCRMAIPIRYQTSHKQIVTSDPFN